MRENIHPSRYKELKKIEKCKLARTINMLWSINVLQKLNHGVNVSKFQLWSD